MTQSEQKKLLRNLQQNGKIKVMKNSKLLFSG